MQILPALVLLSYFTNSALAAASRMRAESTSSGRTRTISTASSQCYSPRADDAEDFEVLKSHPTNSALHIACCNPSCTIETIEGLLTEGAEVNQRNHLRQTPLMLACQAGVEAAVIDFLIKQGALVEKQYDGHWKSLLHYACEGANLAVIRLLLEQYHLPILTCCLRADQTMTDMSNSPAVKELLLSHQAKIARERREAYADEEYENIQPAHLLGISPVPEEEDFELIEIWEASKT